MGNKVVLVFYDHDKGDEVVDYGVNTDFRTIALSLPGTEEVQHF